ncbi:MAG TPA: ABC transporter permease [Candidatus Polarisedimenticolia bacterium]|nr:ABC transporter permease [Candidatus Polarisedimenticolia bacterium]
MSALAASATLARREVVRFARQRSRVVGALGQPLLFWLLLGGGLKASFRPAGGAPGPDGDYMRYFHPGIIALTLLFTAIFSTISVVEDRKGGFLQGVLAAPVPRWSIVAGQAAGGSLLAVLQGAFLLMLAPAVGVPLTAAGAAAALGVMAVIALTFTGMGLMLAWRLDSTQGFHAIMNLALLPMWLLSGAFFPAAGAPSWLAWIMAVNPMTYGMAALRRAMLLGGDPSAGEALPALGPSLGILALSCAAALAGASLLARRASA